MYWGNYTTANEEKQSAFPIRSAYPDRQGRVLYFFLMLEYAIIFPIGCRIVITMTPVAKNTMEKSA